MEMLMRRETSRSHWWWLDSHSASGRSLWLQSTLGDLEMKTKAMLKLIEEDADSFAKRAEMYYKKRPELIAMVEDFYRAYRSLAERYDQHRPDSVNHVLTTYGSPFLAKGKSISITDQCYNGYESRSETYDVEEDSAESEVDDPLQEEDDLLEYNGTIESAEYVTIAEETRKVKISSSVDNNEELLKLREEIAQLNEENRIQKEQLLQKDEEKREAIRQLSVAIEMQRTENSNLRKTLATHCSKKQNNFEFTKLKDSLLGKWFSNGSQKLHGTVIAL